AGAKQGSDAFGQETHLDLAAIGEGKRQQDKAGQTDEDKAQVTQHDPLSVNQERGRARAHPLAGISGLTSRCSTRLTLIGGRWGAGQRQFGAVQRPFSRSRSNLPVLKKGTRLSWTSTASPVRGLRPVRASRSLTEKAPKPRNS